MPDDSVRPRAQSSPSIPNPHMSDAAPHRVKQDQGGTTRQHKPTQRHQTEQKSSRSRTSKSAEKPGRTDKHSSRHRSSSQKHKTPSAGTKPETSSKT